MNRIMSRYTQMYLLIYASTCWMGLMYGFTIDQTDIDNDLVITQSGTWQLTESVTFTTPYAISIATDDVLLDLQGYVIDGQNTGECAITVAGDNCSILDGRIINTVTTAIEINGSTGAQITQIAIEDSNVGISVFDSSFAVIGSLTIAVCSDQGIIISGNSNGSTLSQAHIRNCVTSGVTISSSSIFLTGVIVHDIAGDGIVLSGNDIQCTGVSSSINTQSGFVISGQTIKLMQCTANLNSQNGILLQSTSQNVSLIGGLASGNGNIGINNLGASSNTSSYFEARVNGVRDYWKITNSTF